MKDNRLGGLALMIGATAGIITMSLHPTAHHGLMSRQEMETLEWLTRGVHALAIASLPLTFVGALAVARQLDSPTRLSLLALVIYGFALIAIMIAASMSGFVAPSVVRQLIAGDPLTDSRRLFLDYTFRLNQAFADVFTFASCVAILLWSFLMVRTRFSKALGLYGTVMSLAILSTRLTGLLHLDAHGFGIVTFTQSIWLIITGLMLRRVAGRETWAGMEKTLDPGTSAGA